jgi:hypothetical protein
VILQRPIYEGFYGQRALQHGLTPAEDQQIAGGLMLGLDFLVMMGALVFFFFRAASDAEEEERNQPPAGKAADGSGEGSAPGVAEAHPVPGTGVRLG